MNLKNIGEDLLVQIPTNVIGSRAMNLEEEYIKSAVAHGKCTINGDYRAGNTAYYRLTKVRIRLSKLPDRGEMIFKGLVKNLNIHVRSAAARDLLPIDEALALNALNKIVKGEYGIISFNAKMMIESWLSK